MVRRSLFLALIPSLLFILSVPKPTFADSARMPRVSSSAYDLIGAVNALRASNGLPGYAVNSILMYTAQNQAEFMAANGIVTHSGPGGIGLTDRLLAAGYPLAGDLSLGGFRAENIISGREDASAQWAVEQWMGDAPHQNTMLSPDLTEIGAGVAFGGGRVYYVIDAARPTNDGVLSAPTPLLGGGSANPSNVAPAAMVIISTPNADGEVLHEVLPGQTLWQIAISYSVKVDDIKRLNNLAGNDIYPGNRLLVRMEAPPASETPTPVPTAGILPSASATNAVPTLTQPAPIITLSPVAAPAPASGLVTGAVIGIVALALLGGGLFTWLGSRKRSDS